MIDKKLVHKRFAKNLDSYHENAKVQKNMAKRLMTFIKNESPKKILEIGCGTGFLTELINENFKFETFDAVDIVEDCKKFINKINPKINFIVNDIEEFLKNNEEKYDLIISNASLQWVSNFDLVINTLKESLNIGGELVFSTFGKENFREIYYIMGTSLNYYSTLELKEKFCPNLIEPEIYILSFDSPKEVLKHLQLTGVNAIENISWTKSDLTKFENGYKNLCSRRITLTYNPIYMCIKK